MDAASLPWSEACLRTAAAAITGVVLGLNRDLHGKPIGVRTLGAVAVACCSLTLAAAQFGEQAGNHAAETMGRATQGLMAGIGFLGGGVILRNPPKQIHGLTTAALVWLTAALGVACGVGAWSVIGAALAAVLLLLAFGGGVELGVHLLVNRLRRAVGERPLPPDRASRS
ncbi:MAG TPA: MgtC/SapB family protein [Nevskia sp.]|nr:MgtC/SapB family protein [Nevskia sp.]